MKLISYNVNGIRSAMNKGFVEWLKEENPDVIGLQEIKAQEKDVDPTIFQDLGYELYWFPAVKKGYSGVAILSKIKPNNVVFGTGIEHMDFEGRTVRVDFDDFSVMSLYLPSGTNIARLDHKFKFMDDFQNYITELKKEIPNLLICGDYNICHEAIDIHNPKTNANSSGFLPEERKWITDFLHLGFVDSFRFFNQEPHNYTWWTYRAGAKSKNLGWRIDYIFVSSSLSSRLRSASIYPEVLMSDHCPISIDLDL